MDMGSMYRVKLMEDRSWKLRRVIAGPPSYRSFSPLLPAGITLIRTANQASKPIVALQE